MTASQPTKATPLFADDTTVVGLISEDKETQYRDDVQGITVWCLKNNLLLNTTKTMELILDFGRKRKGDPAHLLINGICVKRVHSLKFLRVHISDDLPWTINIRAIIKKPSSVCIS